MKRYRMVGTQQVQLPDGRWLQPGCGEFKADLGAQEDFLLRVGAIEECAEGFGYFHNVLEHDVTLQTHAAVTVNVEPVKKRGHHGD